MFFAFPIHPALISKGLPLSTALAAFRCFLFLGHVKLEKLVFNKFFH